MKVSAINPLDASYKETQLVALFVGMFIDQGISKDRMLRLATPDNLANVYDFVERRAKTPAITTTSNTEQALAAEAAAEREGNEYDKY